MELYLQFGHGMKDLCKTLLQKWGKGAIILSPRDLEHKQIHSFAREFRKLNGDTLLDPQLYYPRANHHRLTSHEYWPDNYSTDLLTGGPALKHMLSKIKELNSSGLTSKYILPGLSCTKANEDWFYIQESIIDKSVGIMDDKNRLATICASSECLRSEEQVEAIVSRSETWDVDGYYVIAEHPNGQYLVDDPIWLGNLLLLCSGLKLQGKEVVVGYCSHQMLCLATANVDAIASGTWLNVRTFTSGRFHQSEEESTSRRAKWYYCPQSLSEYKMPFLDIAYKAGILGQMAPDSSMNSTFAEILFSGAQPSLTSFGEREAFRHYLQCLHEQCKSSQRSSFNDTLLAHELLLETAETFIKLFHKCGVRGQDRDFSNIIDVNRAALAILQRSRGFVLERQWS